MRASRFGSRLVTSLALLLAAPVLLGVATDASAHSRSPHGERDGGGAARSDGGATADRDTTSPRRLIDEFGAPDDLATHARVVRELVAQATGLPIPSTLASETVQINDLSAVPAGDLDGDGLTDVLVTETRGSGSTVVIDTVAIAGTSGVELWRAPVSVDADDAFGYPVGDLDGDGADDVVVTTRVRTDPREEWHCVAPMQCAGSYAYEYSWTVQALRGSDGVEMWSRVLDGAARTDRAYRYADSSELWHETFVGTNLGVVAIPAGDLDGDGADEMVLNRYDETWSFNWAEAWTSDPYGHGDGTSELLTVTAEVLDGATGTVLHTRVSEPGPQGALLWPAGDLDGDGTGDLVWQTDSWFLTDAHVCAGAAGQATCQRTPDDDRLALEVVAVDGTTYADHWTAILEGYAWVAPGGDLDGDGATDLLMDVWVDDEPWSRYGVVAGATGDLLWTREHDPLTVVSVGPVGGAPGDDLVAIQFEKEVGGDGELAVERVDGTTGDVLFVTDPGEGHWDFLDFVRFGDADGDGVDDLLFEAQGDSHEIYSWTEATTVESGATGAKILAEEFTWAADLAAGDVDADGTVDLLTVTSSDGYEPGGDGSWMRVRSLPEGAALWGSYTSIEPGWMRAIPIPDATGDGGGDLVVFGPSYDGTRYGPRVELREGRTGVERWSYGQNSSG